LNEEPAKNDAKSESTKERNSKTREADTHDTDAATDEPILSEDLGKTASSIGSDYLVDEDASEYGEDEFGGAHTTSMIDHELVQILSEKSVRNLLQPPPPVMLNENYDF
jgi:hypothetical protein